MFTSVYHGKFAVGYIPWFVGGELPRLLGEHPVLWMHNGGAIIKGAAIALLCWQMSTFIFIRNNNYFLLPIFILFSFILYQITVDGTIISQLYTSFFYNVFPFCFLFFFYKIFLTKIFYKEELSANITVKEERKNKTVYLLYLLAFILGISNDFIGITSFYFFILLFLFNKSFNNLSRHSILLMIISLGTALTISFLNPAFIYAAKNYGAIRSFKQIISETISLFNNFNIEFLNVFKNEFIILCGIILLLYILIFIIFKKENNKSILILIPIMFASSILFYYTLILVGVQPERGALQELTHNDLVIEMKIFLSFIIYLELGFLYKNAKVFYSFISLFIILAFCLHYTQISQNIKILKDIGIKKYALYIQDADSLKEKYKKRYILERIFVYYAYKEIQPVLLGGIETESFFFSYDIPDDINYDYIKILYKIENFPYEIKYVDTMEKVKETYLQNGGPIISNQEIIEADFNKLFDRNFVLNGEHK